MIKNVQTTTSQDEITKSDRMKLMNEYMTTYRSILVMQQGTNSAPDILKIHQEAMSMVDEIYNKSLEISGLIEMLDK